MAWLLILGLAVSSSIDNLGVGMSYGIRKIKISHASNMMIAFICFVFSYIGIYFGKWISAVLPGFLPVLLAAFILSVIGIRIILLAVPRKQRVLARQEKKAVLPVCCKIRRQRMPTVREKSVYWNPWFSGWPYPQMR